MAFSIIMQAKRLLAHKKYNEVIRLLEPHVLEYRESFAFHFYVGMAYLNLGEMGNAKDYFSTARKLKPNDPDLMAATAAIALRRGDTGKAVEYYLRILDLRPSYELAKKGLSAIRKYNTAEARGDFIRTNKIKSLYPMPSIMEFYVKYIKITILSFSLAIILGLLIVFTASFFKKPDRVDISSLALSASEKKQAVDMEGSFRNVLPHGEILDIFSKAQDEFKAYNDNLSQVEINKILNSNATFSIKQKALLLQDLLQEPRVDTIKNIFSYTDVQKEPYLYNGCYVMWKGMPTNIVVDDMQTRFDLLVGYETKVKLEGTVRVECNFVSDIDKEKPITVLSQIRVTEGDVWALRGITIHQSVKPIE